MEVIIGTLIIILVCMSPIIMSVASGIYNKYEENRGNISGIDYLKNQLNGHKISTTAYFIETKMLGEFVSYTSYDSYDSEPYSISDVFHQPHYPYKTRLEYIAKSIQLVGNKLSLNEVTDTEWMYLTDKFNEMLKEKFRYKSDPENLESTSKRIGKIQKQVDYQAEALEQIRESDPIEISGVKEWDEEYNQ